MILRITNTETEEILLGDEFTAEEIPNVLPSWDTQAHLYSIQTPPISARLEIIDPDAIP